MDAGRLLFLMLSFINPKHSAYGRMSCGFQSSCLPEASNQATRISQGEPSSRQQDHCFCHKTKLWSTRIVRQAVVVSSQYLHGNKGQGELCIGEATGRLSKSEVEISLALKAHRLDLLAARERLQGVSGALRHKIVGMLYSDRPRIAAL